MESANPAFIFARLVSRHRFKSNALSFSRDQKTARFCVVAFVSNEKRGSAGASSRS